MNASCKLGRLVLDGSVQFTACAVNKRYGLSCRRGTARRSASRPACYKQGWTLSRRDVHVPVRTRLSLVEDKVPDETTLVFGGSRVLTI